MQQLIGAGSRRVALLVAVAALAGAARAEEQTAITIYSSARPGAIPPELYRPLPGGVVANARSVPGYAVVRQDRSLQLPQGRSTLRFTDVAALIDPTTVTFASLTEPRTLVLQQSFQFDLVSIDKLLLKYIDKPVVVERISGPQATSVSGTLLSASDGLVLRAQDGSIHALHDYSQVSFPALPGGLDTRPTLVWDVISPRAGEQRTRVTYQTGGITWWADYNALFRDGSDANSGLLDLSAWVSIVNLSGQSYADAVLKLIAGDVNRLPEPTVLFARRAFEAPAPAAEAGAAGFSEQPFFEYHLYTLGRRASLPNDSTQQLELFEPVHQIPVQKLLVYAGAPQATFGPRPLLERELGVSGNTKVAVYLQFRNDAKGGLGLPLPSGRIRVSKLDPADQSAELIGEDRLDHTPKGELVRVRMGDAFDVVGERHQLDFAADNRARWIEEEIEIRLHNHKDQAVNVQVREALNRWSNWRILSQSQAYEKLDAHTIAFAVTVPKQGEAAVRYRVRYTW